MDCLFCECEKTSVITSIKYAGTVYRQRKCLKCDVTFWTEELEVIDIEDVKQAIAFKKAKYRAKKRGG